MDENDRHWILLAFRDLILADAFLDVDRAKRTMLLIMNRAKINGLDETTKLYIYRLILRYGASCDPLCYEEIGEVRNRLASLLKIADPIDPKNDYSSIFKEFDEEDDEVIM